MTPSRMATYFFTAISIRVNATFSPPLPCHPSFPELNILLYFQHYILFPSALSSSISSTSASPPLLMLLTRPVYPFILHFQHLIFSSSFNASFSPPLPCHPTFLALNLLLPFQCYFLFPLSFHPSLPALNLLLPISMLLISSSTLSSSIAST